MGNRALSLGLKRPVRGDHSPQSSAEFMNMWGYTSNSPIRFIGVELN